MEVVARIKIHIFGGN